MRILKVIVSTALIFLLCSNCALAKTDTIQAESATPICSSAQGSVSITVKDGSSILFDIPNVPWITDETVHLAMLNATNVAPSFTFQEQFSCPFGDLVTQIGNIQQGNGKFWFFSINGVPSQRGIDTAILQNNDSILWEIKAPEDS